MRQVTGGHRDRELFTLCYIVQVQIGGAQGGRGVVQQREVSEAVVPWKSMNHLLVYAIFDTEEASSWE